MVIISLKVSCVNSNNYVINNWNALKYLCDYNKLNN